MVERTQVTEEQQGPGDGASTPITTDVRTRPGGPALVPAADTVFRLKDLHVYYGAFLALRGVTLDIGRNEITAFIGPSG
jgi:ABC-type glutathione transport system ATPase component